jgi:Protein of unknown function (DUF4232)
MTRFWHIAGVVAGACSLVVVIAACGSSSSSTAAGGSSSSAPSTSPAGSSPAISSAPPSSGGISPHAAVPACTTEGLDVQLGSSQGAAGSIIQTITFTNGLDTPCTLTGYPGVSLTTGSQQIGAAAARDGSVPVTTVTLGANGVASAAVQITQAGNYPAQTCEPTPATAIQIYPPNQTVPVSVPITATGCAVPTVILLHVSAVQAGSGQ